MTKQTSTAARSGLWQRTTQALGKFFAGVVSLPENRRHEAVWTDFPRFPPF